jgi:hypothetical protein
MTALAEEGRCRLPREFFRGLLGGAWLKWVTRQVMFFHKSAKFLSSQEFFPVLI